MFWELWDSPRVVLGSTPMRLKKHFTLLLQLISFSITKTFHALSQMSLIYEANKPSNNRNLLKSWYPRLLLSVTVWHRELMHSFWLHSYNGWLPQTQHFIAARGLALNVLSLCSSQMTFKWMQVCLIIHIFNMWAYFSVNKWALITFHISFLHFPVNRIILYLW